METELDVPQGKFKLQRIPYRKKEQHRAWDAADEYILRYLSRDNLISDNSKLIILNDSFGALAVALHKYKPIVISDSYLSQYATKLNLDANNLSHISIELRGSLDWPADKANLIILKVPKTLALLEDQLIRMHSLLLPNTVIIAAGMVKAMPSSVWKLIERYLGETKPSLAIKKARLIFVNLAVQADAPHNPYPVNYLLENTSYQISNHANVFSRESLDIGTRFLLNHLPKNTSAKNIVDLGCGNGVVGMMLAQTHVLAKLFFVDESYMAIASAEENFNAAFTPRDASFRVADGLTEFETESIDLIVCNPPFHQQNIIGNQIALTMFKQSYRVLQKGGALWVIGNRHLAYHSDLKTLFGSIKQIASNDKFIILQANK